MTDAEIKKEDFLEFINMVLSTGEIPNLLAKDDKQIWMGDLLNDFIKEFKDIPEPTDNDIWNYFVTRVRDNFHICLCFSPVGQKFRNRSQKFPALFNECAIDWFLLWPEDALVSVAETFIKNFSKLDTKKEVKECLMVHMGNVHLLVQEVIEIYKIKMGR